MRVGVTVLVTDIIHMPSSLSDAWLELSIYLLMNDFVTLEMMMKRVGTF
jgi:hypothetical protein